MRRKSPCITILARYRSRNSPTDSADEASSFLFRRTDLARINMKTHHPSIDAVLLVDLTPGAAAVHDARLEVVDPIDRRHASEPAIRLVVDVVPGQLVHGTAPD